MILLAFVCQTRDCTAQSASRKLLLALSKADHTLAIVDPVTFKIITRIPVVIDPHEVIASPDGKSAYVSIYGVGSRNFNGSGWYTSFCGLFI